MTAIMILLATSNYYFLVLFFDRILEITDSFVLLMLFLLLNCFPV